MGVYDDNWNAGLTGVEAASVTSLSTAIAYSSPFLGAILADALLGDFWVIALGTSFLYIPGMILIALTTVPELLGETFNMTALRVGLTVLYPLGAGAIKSVVNIFGAKQFHPVLQSSMLSEYYVNFYMFINIGALVGGILIPIVAQHNVTVAYFIPVATMALVILVFVLGSSRYVKVQPNMQSLLSVGRVIGNSAGRCRSLNSNMSSNGGRFSDHMVQSVKQLLCIIPITALVVPFNIVYAQMSTTFIVQGTVMKNVSFIDASMMQNMDAISVLVFGALIGQVLYPFLERKGIRIATTHKFAMGTFCTVLSCVCTLVVEYQIHATYNRSGKKISILWQSFSYFLIGCGELFAISSAYEAAYKVAPKEQKALASAINLFFIGGIPNFICMALDEAVKPWFTDASGSGNIASLEAYASTNIINFWWLLIFIGLGGCLINVLPWTRNWVEGVEEMAQENLIAVESERRTKVTAAHGSDDWVNSNDNNEEDTDAEDYLVFSIEDLEDQGSDAATVGKENSSDASNKEPSIVSDVVVDSWENCE
ncbi:15 member 4 [Seminavis robusta]|uniref:15 member 4 n=1 Tax=Seminavis robusta TaxID=568900 RepID=A0A9N8I0N7_9STRA|nr:15 member 4 [Seminavis robusta]|eukprot:Sro2795_g337320.1 15 member 4 (539) ;mRNA; r:9912-11528